MGWFTKGKSTQVISGGKLVSPETAPLSDEYIADSGLTLERWKSYQTAVLHYKPHTCKVVPDIWAEKHEGNEWVIYPWESKFSKTIQDYKLDN